MGLAYLLDKYGSETIDKSNWYSLKDTPPENTEKWIITGTYKGERITSTAYSDTQAFCINNLLSR